MINFSGISSLNHLSTQSVRYFWRRFVGLSKPGGFLRNVGIVGSGAAIAQGIQAVTSPVLTRLYSPTDFGILSVYLSVVPILTVLATLQYSQAIVLPKEDKDAKTLLGLGVRLAAVFLFITFAITLPAKFVGLEKLGLKDIPWVILPVIAVATFINVLGELFNYWNIRTKSFALVSIAVTSGAVAAVLLSIGMGLLAAGWWGLVAGMLVGKIVNLLVQLFPGNRLMVVQDSLSVSGNKPFARVVLREYADFPKFRLPQILLNIASQHLPAIMFVAFFGPAIGGLYALTRRVLSLPVALISESIRKVFYQKAADLDNRGLGLFATTLKTTLGLAGIGIIPFGVIALFGPGLFSFIFGGTWRVAGVYAAWLSLWMYFAFCNVPSVAAIPVVGLQKQLLVYEAVMFATRILSLGAGVIAGKPMVAVVLYAITGAVLNLSLILFVLIQLFHGKTRHTVTPLRT